MSPMSLSDNDDNDNDLEQNLRYVFISSIEI